VSALWTVAEVAQWAKVDASTLRRWARSGQVAHSRVGTRIRFTDEQRAAVVQVREAREHTPANPWGLSPHTRRRTA
jgi:excisionase family DNA binding protein